MSRRTNRETRLFRLALDPHCWYCGCELVHWETGSAHGRLPDNFATVEHLHDRLQGPRPAKGTLVLGCFRCNHDRNRYGQLLRDAEGLRPQGHGPRPEYLPA